MGLRPSQERKYRELIRRLREFLKNEINRKLNRLTELYKLGRIIVERIDFSGQKHLL
jgi:putative transposase